MIWQWSLWTECLLLIRMMMGMFAAFNRLKADYETAWLEAMIDHHSDAITCPNGYGARCGKHWTR